MIWEHLSLDTLDANGVPTLQANLTNGPQYANLRYAPVIAARNPGGLAGSGPYADVDDELTIDVLGETPAICAANLMRLLGWFDQAAEWWDNQNVDPVQLRGRVSGGTQDVTALVLGPQPGQEPARLTVADAVATPGSSWVIRDVTIPFQRRPRWLLPLSQRDEQTVSGVIVPAVTSTTFAFPQRAISSPGALRWQIPNFGTAAPAIAAVTASAEALQLIALGLNGVSSSWVAVADAANRPLHGTNIVRYTPVNNLYAATGPLNYVTTRQYRTIACILALRTNNAANAWLVRATMRDADNVLYGVTAPTVYAPGITTPTLVVLPPLTFNGPIANQLRLEAAVIGTPAGKTIDISYVAVVALDDPTARIVQFGNNGLPRRVYVWSGEYANVRQSIGAWSPTSIEPVGNPAGTPYTGDTSAEAERTMASAWIQTLGAAWRPDPASTIEVRHRCRQASLIPEIV